MSSGLDPMINWAGGKRWMKEVVEDFFILSGSKGICEPFAGGMAISLHIQPEKVLINDINLHLINMYKHIANGMKLNFKKNNIIDYEMAKSRFNNIIDSGDMESEEFALLFYYLLKHSFNGICRYSKRQGHFNVPKGDKNALIPSSLSDYQRATSNWAFESEDFEDLTIDENMFVFVDAPSDEAFDGYWHTGFTKFDLKRMVEWSGKLKNPVVLTNSPTDYILELLEVNDFDFKIVTSKHNISADAKSRGRKPEVVAWKNCEAPESILRLP